MELRNGGNSSEKTMWQMEIIFALESFQGNQVFLLVTKKHPPGFFHFEQPGLAWFWRRIQWYRGVGSSTSSQCRISDLQAAVATESQG